MAEQYSHTLIAKLKDFVPSGVQIHKFLASLVSEGVVPDNPDIDLRVLTGKVREYPYVDPFSGEKMSIEIRDRKKLGSLDEFAKATESLKDYELEVASTGRPKIPPLPIDFNESYHVGVMCRVYSKSRSTSDPHDETVSDKKIIRYGKICSDSQRDGTFTNPHDMQTFLVPYAGCARFWIEFQLGKFLFPKFANESLEFLNPFIVAEAEKTFETEFVQGCYWG